MYLTIYFIQKAMSWTLSPPFPLKTDHSDNAYKEVILNKVS